MTAHAIASNRAMPNLPIIEPPSDGGWIAPGLTAAAGVVGTWIVHWFRNRGQAQRRMDDRFNEWTARRDAELSEVHKAMYAELAMLRDKQETQAEQLARLSTFAVTLHYGAVGLAKAVIEGKEATHLAHFVLGIEPPEFLRDEDKR